MIFVETNELDSILQELLTPTPLMENNTPPTIMRIGKLPTEE
jgi:hypothetical protein